MKKFNRGDLVVLDDGLHFQIGIYGDASISYEHFADDGSISIGITSSLYRDQSFDNELTLLESNFEPPPKDKYCPSCGNRIYIEVDYGDWELEDNCTVSGPSDK